MKKILFVINGISTGGAERVVIILANALIKQGYDVSILAFYKSNTSYKIDAKVNVIFSKKNSTNYIKRKILRIKNIREAIIKNNIDIIIPFSTHYVLSAIIANIGLHKKIIGSERNDPSQTSKFMKIVRNILYKRLDNLVCQTVDAKMYFSKKIQNKSVVIKNPLISNLPSRYEGKREKRVVSFSRFEPQKNIPMLIDAFELFHKEYPDYILELYGDGYEKNKIIEYINSKNLQKYINVNPFCIDIHEKILKAKMFVLASNYEGLSNSMLESLAIGLPTICTDCPCGGARMMIEDGVNGFLIEVGNTKQLFEKMKLLAMDDDLANNFSLNSIKIKEELSEDKIISEWLDIINN